MECRLGGTRVHCHPLLLLLLLLAIRLGMGAALWPLMLSLTCHEAAHLLAARLLGVRVEQLNLMPFGGAAMPANVYTLSPFQLLLVAAAGPMANLLLLVVAAALTQWGVLSPVAALELLRINLALMLFNLLPALPLDGGRMLYAITARRLGRARSVALGILMGRIVAVVLIMATIHSFIVTRQCNLSWIACALFIASSAAEERRALSDLRAISLLNALKAVREPIAVRLCAVDSGCRALRALRGASPDAATLFAVYHDDHLTTFTDERVLLNLALDDREALVGDAIQA